MLLVVGCYPLVSYTLVFCPYSISVLVDCFLVSGLFIGHSGTQYLGEG